MAYDGESFLAGLAVGRALKGWATAGKGGGGGGGVRAAAEWVLEPTPPYPIDGAATAEVSLRKPRVLGAVEWVLEPTPPYPIDGAAAATVSLGAAGAAAVWKAKRIRPGAVEEEITATAKGNRAKASLSGGIVKK